MVIDSCNILCGTLPIPVHDLKVKVTDLYVPVLCLSFYYVSVCELLMDLIHVWHDDRYWAKILCGTICIPVHDPMVKVTDLYFFYVKFLC